MWKMAVAALLAVLAGAAAAVWVAGEWQPRDETAVPEWTTLPNGLRFRVQRIEGAKDVAVVTVYGVGSDHDPPGQAGLAHLAEHLYVTSAAGAAEARDVDQWLGRYRRLCSATTYPTHTCIAGAVSPGHLDEELRDAATRMSDLRIEGSDLDRERPRVLEQIADHDTDVSGWVVARRLAMERIHPGPSAAHRGGTKADVERLSLDDIRAFARRAYCPANARVVVTGDVDPAAVAAQCREIFAGLPAGEPAPELPVRQPIPGEVRIEAGEKPGPAFEPSRGVCIAYPCRIRTHDERAMVIALTSWTTIEEDRSNRVGVLSGEQSIHVISPLGDASADDVSKRFDAVVADFEQHATGPAAAARIRDSMRRAEEALKSLRQAGIEWAAPAIDEDRLASLAAAVQLATDKFEFHSLKSLLAGISRLTNAEMRRWVATWHVPERRVVVDWNGWRKADTDEEPAPPAPASRRAAKLETIPEVRVILMWDEATRTHHRMIGDVEYAKDDDLEKAIKAAHAKLVDDGKPDAPVTIDADHRIPWNEVITVVNVIKRCGIEKIEFAMGAPAKKESSK